jgi:alpha-galactosidase
MALLLTAPERSLLYLWHRGGTDAEIAFELGPEVHAGHLVERYPCRLPAWQVTDGPAGSVLLTPGLAGPTARVYEVLQEPR